MVVRTVVILVFAHFAAGGTKYKKLLSFCSLFEYLINNRNIQTLDPLNLSFTRQLSQGLVTPISNVGPFHDLRG